MKIKAKTNQFKCYSSNPSISGLNLLPNYVKTQCKFLSDYHYFFSILKPENNHLIDSPIYLIKIGKGNPPWNILYRRTPIRFVPLNPYFGSQLYHLSIQECHNFGPEKAVAYILSICKENGTFCAHLHTQTNIFVTFPHSSFLPYLRYIILEII